MMMMMNSYKLMTQQCKRIHVAYAFGTHSLFFLRHMHTHAFTNPALNVVGRL